MWFLLGMTCLQAQEFVVNGKVSDFHNRAALAGAFVKIGSQTVQTDSRGIFSLKILKGEYRLEVSHPDCEIFHEKLNVDRNISLTITLEHHLNEIQGVTLHAAHKNGGSLVVKTLDSRAIARNATENLGNLLAGISGVGSLKTGNNISKPIIHGLYGSRIAILNNGVKLAEQEWGIEHAPNVDINNFEHIDVIKGASALKYGNGAVGGVVLLEPENYPKKDSVMGSMSLSGISNGRGTDVDVRLAQTWKNGWVLKTNGSFRKAGDMHTPDYNLMNTGMQNSGFNFGVQKSGLKNGFSFDYYLTHNRIGILRSSHISSAEDLAEALSSQKPIFIRDFSYGIDNPKQEIEHHIAKISGYHRFESFGKLTATYSFQYNHRKEYDIRRTDELSKKAALDLELVTHDFNVNDLIERSNWSLETGINAGYQNNYSNPETEARRLVPNYDRYYAGIYSVYKYKVLPSLDLEAGLRYDFDRYDVTKWYDLSDWNKLYAGRYARFVVRINQNRILTNPELDYNNLSLNGGVVYHPSGEFSLRFNYARIARSPNIAELFADGLHHSAAIIEKGNMEMKTETGNQFNLVADARFDVLGGLQVSLNPYYFYTRNFVNQIPGGYQNTQWGDFIVWQYQQIDARMYGADMDIDWQLTDHLKYRGSASYVNGQDLTHDVPLILMMPANFSNSIEYSREDWKGFYVNASNRTVVRQKRFPVYNVSIRLFDNQGNPYNQEVDISTPPKGYSLWNIQTGFRLCRHLGVDFSVQNLFNISYRDYLNRLRYFSDEVGRNFILSLKYHF